MINKYTYKIKHDLTGPYFQLYQDDSLWGFWRNDSIQAIATSMVVTANHAYNLGYDDGKKEQEHALKTHIMMNAELNGVNLENNKLKEEAKEWIKIHEDMHKQRSEYLSAKESWRVKLEVSESLNKQLEAEIQRLKTEGLSFSIAEYEDQIKALQNTGLETNSMRLEKENEKLKEENKQLKDNISILSCCSRCEKSLEKGFRKQYGVFFCSEFCHKKWIENIKEQLCIQESKECHDSQDWLLKENKDLREENEKLRQSLETFKDMLDNKALQLHESMKHTHSFISKTDEWKSYADKVESEKAELVKENEKIKELIDYLIEVIIYPPPLNGQ